MLRTSAAIALIVPILFACNQSELSDDQRMDMAIEICQNSLILDSHIDWPESVYNNPRDISNLLDNGDFDLIRANKGGLNAVMSVIYINSSLDVKEARILYDSLYNIIDEYPAKYADKFASAFTPEDVKNNFGNKLFSIPFCLENGSPIGNEIGYLTKLKNDGISYITLNHDKSNQISDSNMDPLRPWNGLSPFGKEVIQEMNHLGIMIDISHSSDSTVFQALRISKAPIVATHSNCRSFIPGLERNLSDTLIKAIAANDGVIMVNFGSFFLDPDCLESWSYLFYESGKDFYTDEGREFLNEYGKTHKLYSNSKQVVDHIEHIIRITGIDHVGIGSDYDGILLAQPEDLQDVSKFPSLVAELLKRGYTEKDINKILAGNFLRVWNKVLEMGES